VSGDEFVFLCEDLESTAAVEALAERIDKAFARPFILPAMELSITASVGLAFAGPGQDISSQLVVQADTAMYQAKRKGGAGHHIIDLRETVRTTQDSLEADLREAVVNQRLDIAYQPIVRCADGEIHGVEALVRWNHPQRGSVSPASIVALAEQSDLIGEIGEWVLERSFLDRGRWLHDHPRSPIDLAVNVSGRQLTQHDLCATVTSLLARTGMDPKALVLEMTEDVVIEDSDRALTTFDNLRRLGIRLALDDFGTGYSSLSYLLRLPVNILKIDQSFISHIGHPQKGAAIVAAVTNLAHVLGLSVVAEGVETQQQHDEISAFGCEFAQGYFYAAPMTAAAISKHLGSLHLATLEQPAS
jgi:EAL domain-containing protein (putative c-di-GMP-specific phosphodiesterase class I)